MAWKASPLPPSPPQQPLPLMHSFFLQPRVSNAQFFSELTTIELLQRMCGRCGWLTPLYLNHFTPTTTAAAAVSAYTVMGSLGCLASQTFFLEDLGTLCALSSYHRHALQIRRQRGLDSLKLSLSISKKYISFSKGNTIITSSRMQQHCLQYLVTIVLVAMLLSN